MSDLIWLSEAQMRWIEAYFPRSHGVPRVDDRRIISGIIFVINGRKRHAMVDTDGRALKLIVHPADVQDRDGAVPLLK